VALKTRARFVCIGETTAAAARAAALEVAAVATRPDPLEIAAAVERALAPGNA
jgi:uroporphyrinogen-III synthase